MCSDESLAVLRHIDDTLNRDVYEYSDPITIGGATGNYMYASPWHTECEWSMVSACALGTIASRANFAIGAKLNVQPTLSNTGVDSFGNVITSAPDSNNALQSYIGSLVATAPFMTFDGGNFTPLPSPAFVYLTTATPAATEILVTILMRRKLARYLPEKPRQKAQAHSHPTSRRGTRTMMSGFAAQYPEEGQPYQHEQTESQDTGVGKRGVFPLGPTDTVHRGVGKKRG